MYLTLKNYFKSLVFKKNILCSIRLNKDIFLYKKKEG